MEAFVKKENAERKAAEEQIQGVLNAENEKRMKEAAALKEKMEREKKEMQVAKRRELKPWRKKKKTEKSETCLWCWLKMVTKMTLTHGKWGQTLGSIRSVPKQV